MLKMTTAPETVKTAWQDIGFHEKDDTSAIKPTKINEMEPPLVHWGPFLPCEVKKSAPNMNGVCQSNPQTPGYVLSINAMRENPPGS